jgi:hypothetical protein
LNSQLRIVNSQIFEVCWLKRLFSGYWMLDILAKDLAMLQPKASSIQYPASSIQYPASGFSSQNS